MERGAETCECESNLSSEAQRSAAERGHRQRPGDGSSLTNNDMEKEGYDDSLGHDAGRRSLDTVEREEMEGSGAEGHGVIAGARIPTLASLRCASLIIVVVLMMDR